MIRKVQGKAALGLPVDRDDILKVCCQGLEWKSKYETLLAACRPVLNLINRVAETSAPTYLLNRVIRELESVPAGQQEESTGIDTDGIPSRSRADVNAVERTNE